MMRNKFFLYISLVFFAVFFIGFAGCGKKAPPLPPESDVPSAVTGLEQNVSNDVVTISWHSPAEKDEVLVEGFYVYRSKRNPEEDCPACPDQFKRIANIYADSAKEPGETQNRFTYTETVEKGYGYKYKVIGYTYEGLLSPDSNVIEFDLY
jgi:predicted small lipoprotein YifL